MRFCMHQESGIQDSNNATMPIQRGYDCPVSDSSDKLTMLLPGY